MRESVWHKLLLYVTVANSVQFVHCRQSHSVTTGCWHGWQPLHKHTYQSPSSFFLTNCQNWLQAGDLSWLHFVICTLERNDDDDVIA